MARPYPSNTTLPKGYLDIQEVRLKLYRAFFTPPKEALRIASDDPEKYKRPIFDINLAEQTLTIYPYQVWSLQSMKPKYTKLEMISIDITLDSDFSVSDLDVESILEMELPSVFTKDYNYGLGFLKEYRYIPKMLEEIGVEHLNVTTFGATSIKVDEKIVHIKRFDLEHMRKELDTITQRARKIVTSKKTEIIVELFLGILNPERAFKGMQSNSSEIDAYLGMSRRFSKGGATKKEKKDALDIIRSNGHRIIKDFPSEFARLHSEIELVALDQLINKFRVMLAKDLQESHWQKMLEENPFILNMAFGIPIVKIQGQAFMGGGDFQAQARK